MEINQESLIQRLYGETAVELAPPEISPYLMEHVLAPYLRGEEIEIKGVDYAAFTPQEMNDFLEFVNQLSDESSKTLGLWEALQKRKPLVTRAPSFC